MNEILNLIVFFRRQKLNSMAFILKSVEKIFFIYSFIELMRTKRKVIFKVWRHKSLLSSYLTLITIMFVLLIFNLKLY